MSIYAAPTTTFEATVSNAPTALTGTLGVRIMDGQGATTLARTTTNIVESPAGSGIYTATLTAPPTAGTYWITWDTGDSNVKWAEEDLHVTSTAAPGPLPSGGDLTTLAAVRTYRQTVTADTGQDALVQAIITRASAAIKRYCGREFTPETAATHKFSYAGGWTLDLYPYDLRTITLAQIDTDTTTPITLTTTDYQLRPTSSYDGTYTYLRLPTYGVGNPGQVTTPYDGAPLTRLRPEREITITGDWGFPSIPGDIEQACIETVKEWAEGSNDRNPLSTPDMGAGDMLSSYTSALPYAARVLLAPYRRITVA